MKRFIAGCSVVVASFVIASASTQPATATCNGCSAGWGIFGSGSSQHGERQSYASETIDSQDFHFAYSDCSKQTYYGNPFNNFVYNNTSTTPRQYSVNQGGNVYFAGGHFWQNGGSYSVPVADTNRGC